LQAPVSNAFKINEPGLLKEKSGSDSTSVFYIRPAGYRSFGDPGFDPSKGDES
jgi:hypothetical protein